MALGRLGARGGFGSMGAQGKGGGTSLAAPVLSPTGDGGFTADPGSATWLAGDVLTVQTQPTGGDWSGATSTPHTITSGEAAAQHIDLALSLSAATYDVRATISRGAITSALSNVIQVTVTASDDDDYAAWLAAA